jgi:hypothetical protein
MPAKKPVSKQSAASADMTKTAAKKTVGDFFRGLLGKFNVRIYGAEQLPPGAHRVEIADVPNYIVVEVLIFKLALDIGGANGS